MFYEALKFEKHEAEAEIVSWQPEVISSETEAIENAEIVYDSEAKDEVPLEEQKEGEVW